MGGGELVVILLLVVLLALPIWALIDVIRRDEAEFTSGTKLIWVIVVIFLWTLGALIYLAIGRPRAHQAS